jgi:DNA mismatch repair protein MutL
LRVVQTTQFSPHNSNIKLLPEHLIDQIKAGEVVERPASLIKELIENSIDACATKIDIHIIDNGMELISVEDDGKGMGFDDLPLAFHRHATSKIERFEDLYKLHSFGFRGEALASIASTARVTCTSSPDDGRKGGRIVIHGGEQKSLTETEENQHGTSFFIKDLFFNTPARLKFIRSANSEKLALKRIINSFILANPTVAFTVKWDEKEKDFFPAVTQENISSRIKKVFFNNRKNETSLISFEGEYDEHKITGFLSLSSTKGNAGKQQYLFANKRIFHDKALHQAVLRSAEKIWPQGQKGHYVLFIDAPPSALDVNVHPNKTHIKFFKSGVIYSLVSSAISKSLMSQSTPTFTNETQQNFQTPDMEYKDAMEFDFTPTQNVQQSMPSLGYQDMPTGFLERTVEKNSSLLGLQDNYFVFQKKNKSYLGLFDRVYKSFFESIFNSSCSPCDVIPLLISEPFESGKNIDYQWLDSFREYGFEFEKLDDGLLVLRSIPEALSGLSLKDFLSPLMNVLIESPLMNSPKEALSQVEVQSFDPLHMRALMEKVELDKLKNDKTLIELNSKNLSKLLK